METLRRRDDPRRPVVRSLTLPAREGLYRLDNRYACEAHLGAESAALQRLSPALHSLRLRSGSLQVAVFVAVVGRSR